MATKARQDVKARTGKALVGVFIVVLVLTVFLSVLLNDATIKVNEGERNSSYGFVMSDVPNIKVKNPRLVDLAMLASHDAVTDKLSIDSPMDYGDASTVLGKVDPITKGFQYRFGKTQEANIGIQLMQGARMFHIKYTNYDGVWYGTHAHLSDTIENYMHQVLTFLDSHPGEIVILLFHPIYFGDETYASFHEWLSTVEYKGRNIYSYVSYGDVDVFNTGDGNERIGELRYNELTNTGKRGGIVLFDRREQKLYKPEQEGEINAYTYKYFDMDTCATHVWHSRMGEKVLINAINETADDISENWSTYSDKLRMNQTQASFSAAGFTDVMTDIGVWSLLGFAEDYNVALLEDQNFDRWLSIMPVFQVDFVTSKKGDFNNRVNDKITAYNTALCAA